jgi:hypothetical protein
MGTSEASAKSAWEIEKEEDELSGKGCESDSFFEVSKVVESREMLEPWVGWFQQLEIPCVIEKRRHGYILWRKGVEVGGKEPISLSELKERKLVSIIGL